ncbi:DMT family transporter [Roseovarius atlanticus]|uniref:DMT family transporter n=1 Tax=Roseovarius atlanticus TaxID=1641875 RepID=UPI001C946017|nr:DMT family transporter [Roseovarius atlanticus]MBY5988162.1 DMT family transporter [Roseovarius atlanticus]MBY6123553.1 DMT family transporter [Roseovarius atlanticus]MBY6148048.1 DMT family transporter [Roseovarius atlanticus]
MSSDRPIWLRLAPVIFLVLWSGGYAVAKAGLGYAAPMVILAMRFALVVAVMAVLWLVLRPPLPKTRAEWGHLAIVGVLIQSVYFGMTYYALEAGVAAGTVALLMTLQPIAVGLIAPRWTGERVGWKQWCELILGLTGAAVVIGARSTLEPPSAAGFVFAIIGLAGIVAASLWEKRFGLQHHPVTSNLVGYAAGMVGILPLLALQENLSIDWSWPFVGVLFYLVVGNSLVAVGLLLAMIRGGDVAKVSALFFLVPPLAAVIAWVMLGEVMPPEAWGGMALAGTGVLLATRKAVR